LQKKYVQKKIKTESPIKILDIPVQVVAVVETLVV
jgi:hypothetical protein